MNNEVILIGKVATECRPSFNRYGIIFYEMGIEILRKSHYVDEIKVISTKPNSCKLNSMAEIGGHIQTENYISEDGKKHLRVYVYSDDIRETDADYENAVTLRGIICKNKGLRYTPSGKTICDLIMATDGFWNSSYYIPVIAWGSLARELSELDIRTDICCSGRLQSRKYKKGDTEYSVLEVSVNSYDVLSASS